MCKSKKDCAVYLCGFMGCGKTTVGRLLARKLGKNYTDLDIYIVEQEGMTIPEIFEKRGEPYFRKLETEGLVKLAEAGGVIATGGGALLSDKNGETAKSAGLVIFIDTPFETCYARIKDDPNRPIAFNSTKVQLKERFDYRRPLYLKNSHHSVSGKGNPMSIVNRIIDIYKKNA